MAAVSAAPQRAIPRSQFQTQTPAKASARARSLYTSAERQSLLDNFDLEVDDRTRAFRSSLSAMLSSFKIRQETEMLKIPVQLRKMTLRELREHWGGSWRGTLLKIAEDKVREREEAFRVLEVERKRKREEEEEAEAEEVRRGKNARKEETGAGDGQRMTKIKTKARAKAKAPAPAPATPAGGPSTLPRTAFNPQLPATPRFPPSSGSKPRAMKRNESLHSINGSPLVVADEGEDEDELPDAEAMEREILAAVSSSGSPLPSSSSASSRSKLKKRAPSFMFRAGPGPSAPAAVPAPAAAAAAAVASERAEIKLSDGRLLSFDPMNLSPGRIDAELEEGGLGEVEKLRVKGRVKEEVVKSLTERMDRWKVL